VEPSSPAGQAHCLHFLPHLTAAVGECQAHAAGLCGLLVCVVWCGLAFLLQHLTAAVGEWHAHAAGWCRSKVFGGLPAGAQSLTPPGMLTPHNPCMRLPSSLFCRAATAAADAPSTNSQASRRCQQAATAAAAGCLPVPHVAPAAPQQQRRVCAECSAAGEVGPSAAGGQPPWELLVL
jgi:hypothetical protein